jgi:hypothetical protein
MKKLCFFLILIMLLAPVFVCGWEITLQWEHSIDLPYLSTYRVYYGTTPGVYTNQIDVGLVTSYTLADLQPTEYYFVLVAIDTDGLESEYTAPELTAIFPPKYYPGWKP